jgi:hypothetical protein
LAGKVALKVWGDLKKSRLISSPQSDDSEHRLERGSYMIVFALKAIELLQDDALKDEAIKSHFHIACRLGLVNNHVLLTLKSVASDKLWKELVGKYATMEVETIYHLMPHTWKINSKANTSGW